MCCWRSGGPHGATWACTSLSDVNVQYMDFGNSSSMDVISYLIFNTFGFYLKGFFMYVNSIRLVHKTFFFLNKGILGIYLLIQKADTYRMLILASVLSHNSKCVAEDFFLT